MSRLETDAGDEWLASDGAILGKLVNRPVNGGMELSLAMPQGEPVVAIVEKMNIGAANAFCDLVRGTYNERKAEQKATSHQHHTELETQRDAENRTEDVPALEEGLQLDFMCPKAVATHCLGLAARLAEVQEEAGHIEGQLSTLYRILEVLNDASTYATEEPSRVPSAESGGNTQPVGDKPRPQELRESGQGKTSEASEEIG